MVGGLQIGELEIGNIDCKNELLYDSIEEKEKFEASFLIPDNVYRTYAFEAFFLRVS